jgi:hypothetical protein
VLAPPDVLRAVAEGVLDGDAEAGGVAAIDPAVKPVTAARGQIDTEQCDGRAGREVARGEIALPGTRIQAKQARMGRAGEAGLTFAPINHPSSGASGEPSVASLAPPLCGLGPDVGSTVMTGWAATAETASPSTKAASMGAGAGAAAADAATASGSVAGDAGKAKIAARLTHEKCLVRRAACGLPIGKGRVCAFVFAAARRLEQSAAPPMLAATWIKPLWDAPATRRTQGRSALALLFVVSFLWALHGALFSASPLPVDDAYITLHNAVVLRAGHDPNYVGVAAVVGATSAPHLVLIALLSSFARPIVASYIASWLAITAYAAGLMRLSFAHGASAAQAWVLVVLGLIAGRMPHHLLNGLETGLALALLVWTLHWATSKTAPRALLPLACGLLPFLRPEFAALSVLLLGSRIAEHFRSEAPLRIRVRHAFADVALAFLGAAPWLGFHLWTTGVPYPSTISAKKVWFAEGCSGMGPKLAMLGSGLAQFASAVGVLGVSALFGVSRRAGQVGLVFALILIGAYYRDFPGAFSHYEQRYLYVTLPFILFGLLVGLTHEKRLVRCSAAALAFAGLVQSAALFPGRFAYYLACRGFTAVELDGVATWARDNLPPTATLLVHDAGYISYVTDFRLVDLVGLKTPSNVHYHKDLTWKSCGARRGDAIDQIALESKPAYAVLLRGWDRAFRISDALRRHGWSVTRVREAPLGYDVFRLSR